MKTDISPFATRGSSYAIPATPTEFAGRTYRSKLEARWACFFDTIGIQADYEPSGFKLKNGTCYLPDFYLPHISMWAEVKPTFLEKKEESKAALLAECTGQKVLFLVGPPDFMPYLGATWDCGDYTVVDYSLDIGTYVKAYQKERRFFAQPTYTRARWRDEFSTDYIKAVMASRADRFDERFA